MKDRYSTDELAEFLIGEHEILPEQFDIIIAKLRAADALADAAGDLIGLAEQAMDEANIDGAGYEVETELLDIRKAITAYEEV